VGFAYAAAAEAALAQARADAGALLVAAEKLPADYPSPEPGTYLFGPLRADALAQLGRAAEATDALAAFLAQAGPNDRLSTRAAVARVRARIAALAGKHEDALRHCGVALESSLAAGLPLEAGRAELLAGECQHLSGRRAAAERLLRSALRRFTMLGATAYVTQVVGALDRAGLSAQPAIGVLEALTPAERAVVTCVCRGLTNGQTARRLLLSTKTVEFHLTNVFRKLDVHGRAELCRVVTEPV
jgi:DNA-binding NarL/FixJ family response regulator